MPLGRPMPPTAQRHARLCAAALHATRWALAVLIIAKLGIAR